MKQRASSAGFPGRRTRTRPVAPEDVRGARRRDLRWFAAAVVLLLPCASSLAESHRYDAAGRLIEVTYPDGFILRYGYDANSNLVSGEVVSEVVFNDGFES